ncbi:MAG: cation diffusion facilitator family transporter [Phycisphaerales bacterium]|nr:cation diffusion facilitator family transporter [Phycisphaerales bacterium]
MAQGSRLVIYAALVGNGLISITKFAAAGITGSAAMMSEGIHSVVDTGNQVLLLYGMKRAERPANERFPFGHGKEVYFWCFVVAIMIFALGAGVSLYEGVHRTLHPEPVTNPIVNYVVLTAAMIFEGAAWYFAWREFKKSMRGRGIRETIRASKDPTTFVVLFEDSAAMLGLLVALIGLILSQALELPVLDGVASIGIGLILAVTAIMLAIRTKSLLIGESADPNIVADVRRRAASINAVEAVNQVLTLHMGPHHVLLTVTLDFQNDLPAGDMEQAIDRLTREIKECHQDITHVFIEAESKRAES